MIACLLAIQAYCESDAFFGRDFGLRNPPRRYKTNQVMRPGPFAMAHVLETSIYRIVVVFYRHLAEFQFPPLYAEKLQSFVNFLE